MHAENNFIRIEKKEILIRVIEEFVPILPHFVEKIYSIENYADKVLKYGNVYVILEQSIIKGFIVFYCNDIQSKKAYISLIAVSDKFKRQNNGTKLVKFVKDIAKTNHMKYLELEVDYDNKGAIAFYEKLGFEIVGEASKSSCYMQMYI